MALETFQYLDSLVATNPVVSDGLVNGDDHIRGIKLALKNTFPNVAGPITASEANLNSLTGWLTNGVTLLADAGVTFKTNATDKITNPVAGEIDLVCAGAVLGRFNATGLAVTGGISATGPITGPGTIPIAGMLMWLSDTLPTESGVWVWANGQAISRTTYPICFSRIGTKFGAGDGSTTFNVIDMQEVSPVGKSGMGGATSPGFLNSVTSIIKTTLGASFGSDTHTLTAGEVPALSGSTDGSHSSTATFYIGDFNFSGGAAGAGIFTNSGFIQLNPTSGPLGAYRQITMTVNIPSLSVSVNSGGGAAHSILNPKRVVNFIVRIA